MRWAAISIRPMSDGRSRLRQGQELWSAEPLMARQVVRIDDLLADPSYTLKEDAKIGGARSMIGVPLMREGEPIGVIILARHRVEPFVETEINLVKAFADKAVIAISVLEREGQLARQARSAEQALELLAGVSKAASTSIDLHALALDCLVQSAQVRGLPVRPVMVSGAGSPRDQVLSEQLFRGSSIRGLPFVQRQAGAAKGRQQHSWVDLAKSGAAVDRGLGDPRRSPWR